MAWLTVEKDELRMDKKYHRGTGTKFEGLRTDEKSEEDRMRQMGRQLTRVFSSDRAPAHGLEERKPGKCELKPNSGPVRTKTLSTGQNCHLKYSLAEDIRGGEKNLNSWSSALKIFGLYGRERPLREMDVFFSWGAVMWEASS